MTGDGKAGEVAEVGGGAGEDDDLVAFGGEHLGETAAEEAAGAGYEGTHGVTGPFGLQRR